MNKTPICWTDLSWNPVTGCTKCSPECKYCYALRDATRWQAAGNPRYENGFKVTLHPEALTEPLAYPRGQPILCFVCSMADLFHVEVPFEYIDKVMTIIENTQHITYQLLTKRAERMAEYFSTRLVPQNVWLGVTCGCRESLYRVDILRGIPAPVRFISDEPHLDDFADELDLTSIDWVITGGESGNKKSRPMNEEWVWKMKELCEKEDVAFTFKQWGDIAPDGTRHSKHTNGCLLRGKEYKAYPTPRTVY